MQSSVREVFKIVLVSVVMMLALPAAYRLWLACNPQPERPRQTLVQFFERTDEENALRRLKTPLPRWTADEKEADPRIYAWLEAHDKTVLPWEWTEEARRKDPEGCRKLWTRLFGEQESEFKSRLKTESKKLKALEREIWIVETVHAHRTNQLERIRTSVSTNVLPMTVRIEHLSKGRFWGWNTKVETVTVSRLEELQSAENGWLGGELRSAREEQAQLTRQMAERRHSSDMIAALRSLAARAEECGTWAARNRSSQELVAGLCCLIRAKGI